jgi:hypothetical protein
LEANDTGIHANGNIFLSFDGVSKAPERQNHKLGGASARPEGCSEMVFSTLAKWPQAICQGWKHSILTMLAAHFNLSRVTSVMKGRADERQRFRY